MSEVDVQLLTQLCLLDIPALLHEQCRKREDSPSYEETGKCNLTTAPLPL